MQLLIATILIILFFAFTYLCCLILAWLYEIRMNKMFRKMQEKIRQLESANFSMALFHVKRYKIMEDYRRELLEIEKVRQFILEKLLFLKKSTLKTKYKNVY